ncbi:hypothetical protein GEMRC1_007368 [Eukaryota sp. GEM-RC1]
MQISVRSCKSQHPVRFVVGEVFPSKIALQVKIHQHALQEDKEISLAANNNTKKYTVTCTDFQCSFRLYSSSKDGINWTVVTYTAHKKFCAGQPKTRLPPSVIAEIHTDDFRRQKILSPSKLAESSSMPLSWKKADRVVKAVQSNLYGTRDASYAVLPMYLENLKKSMPGSVTELIADNSTFKMCFVALAASIEGWNFCKKVICVDGTYIRTQYLGVVLIATALDGNQHTFPLAYAVVENETIDSWSWFLTQLASVLHLEDCEAVTIISDRQKGLLSALRNVLPYCHHAYCVWHLAENATGKGSKHAKPFIYQLARSTTIEEYNCLFEELNQVSPSAADYISRIEPEFWVECLFSGNRHGMITSNLVESMNACIAEARELPVTHMLEVIREKIAKWFLARREEGKKAENGVTVAVEKSWSLG